MSLLLVSGFAWRMVSKVFFFPPPVFIPKLYFGFVTYNVTLLGWLPQPSTNQLQIDSTSQLVIKRRLDECWCFRYKTLWQFMAILSYWRIPHIITCPGFPHLIGFLKTMGHGPAVLSDSGCSGEPWPWWPWHSTRPGCHWSPGPAGLVDGTPSVGVLRWWKKSCTTLDGWNPINNGKNDNQLVQQLFHPQLLNVFQCVFSCRNLRTWECGQSF